MTADTTELRGGRAYSGRADGQRRLKLGPLRQIAVDRIAGVKPDGAGDMILARLGRSRHVDRSGPTNRRLVVTDRSINAIRRLLDATPSSRVLEVGVGGGNVLERIGGVQFGIDLSPFILRKARIRLGARASLVRSDAMALPFRDGAFDRVYCSEVLEHVLDPESVIREMHRVLAPGGIAVISVPNEVLINLIKRILFGLPLGSRLVAGEYRMSRAMDEEWHLHAFGRARLEQALAGRFGIETLVGVPSRLMPLRLVARLSSPACARTAV